MSDLISRPDAIDAFYRTDVEFRPTQINEVLSILEKLPSAEPTDIYRSGYKDGKKRGQRDKRRKGKWIWDDEGYHCSLCGFHAHGNTLECLDGTYRYCPWCGADMRGEQDA